MAEYADVQIVLAKNQSPLMNAGLSLPMVDGSVKLRSPEDGLRVQRSFPYSRRNIVVAGGRVVLLEVNGLGITAEVQRGVEVHPAT